MQSIYNKYAQLLTHYCLQIEKNEKVFIRSTYLSEPLLQEIEKEILLAGGIPEFTVDFNEKERIFFENAEEHQLKHTPFIMEHVMSNFDAYLAIRAPFNLRDMQNIDSEKKKIFSATMKPVMQNYSRRTADGQMKRSLCQFPTLASAQDAGMSLSEYEKFVYGACFLFEEDPVKEWLQVRKDQQTIVDYLNKCNSIHYKSDKMDIQFSTKGRTWINSDGRNNMPSGEVFTSPVEDSGNGYVSFDFPAVYGGHEVENVRLEVKNGEVVKWSAEKGKKILDEVFDMPGARFFGEIAIGTNYHIDRFTRNILFDEKIGGTVHMAVGQSYFQSGGKNESSVHWDMISGMEDNGEIYADGTLIYKGSKFII
ncbi:MAG: aminopeptidase [Chitinophagaceae bacterium]|nr:MAG: aminopeptidase [Chitinophagaceae bacterium]